MEVRNEGDGSGLEDETKDPIPKALSKWLSVTQAPATGFARVLTEVPQRAVYLSDK